MKINQISMWAAVGLITGASIITSCSKSTNSTASLPAIGGYNSSNDVGNGSLIAHWPFDGNYNERLSGTTSSTAVNASFTTGENGNRQALNLNNGYLLYPTINALSSANAISSVTVSAWVKVANNGKTASEIFALTQATSAQGDWNQGPINMYVETGNPIARGDTIDLHGAFHTYSGGNYSLGGDNINDYGVAGTDFQIVKGNNQWVHFVMVYDGSGSNVDLYANGAVVSNKKFRNRTTGTPPVGIGNIVLSTPTQVLIGGWPNAATGYVNSAIQTFEGLFTGSIDEVRVYNRALPQSDISALYNLELAGR